MTTYLLLGLTLAVGQVQPGSQPGPPGAMEIPGAAAGKATFGPLVPGEPFYAPPNSSMPMLPTYPVIHQAPGQGTSPGTTNTTGKDATSGTNGPHGAKDSCPANGDKDKDKEEELHGCFLQRLWQAYVQEITKKDDRWEKKKDEDKDKNGNGSNGDKNGNGSNGDKNGKEEKKDDPPTEERPRRALPEPWSSPPFPGHEYQGYPLIGVPEDDTVYPIMKAIYAGPWGDEIKNSGIKFEGWVTGAGTWSTARETNTPAAYWIVPNHYELDQLVFKLERYPDTVQQDHIDWGFRSLVLYGMDYRYTMAGGWGSDQLIRNNNLYGWDPTEQYFNVYIPGILGGTDIRVGRWIACPDIETQYSVDNYMGSHSLLFTFDTYTQTGIMLTQNINQQWMVQAVLHSGTDMAPWYPGAIPTAAFGVRWVAEDNNDAIYAWQNALNDAQFRHFEVDGQPAGHDNFNYFVATWEHRFCETVHTKTEAYYMWEYNGELGGTPILGPVEPYGGGGGNSPTIPGLSQAYGVLNYTMFALNTQDYITLRNEWWRDTTGFRAGTPGNYTSHTIGLSHNFNAVMQIRPEIGYYRNWDNEAFDNGTKHGIVLYGFDMTLRF
jgi:hypothetical protein